MIPRSNTERRLAVRRQVDMRTLAREVIEKQHSFETERMDAGSVGYVSNDG